MQFVKIESMFSRNSIISVLKHYAAILFIVFISFSCNNSGNENNKIIIFHAGSLSVPFGEIIKAYKAENPNVEIFAESSGSVAAARKITDLNKPCDILAVADFLVIDNMMIPAYADSNFAFASNEMVVAYTGNSKYADSINISNWFNILLKEDVTIGRSDPDADPCGYRNIFIFKLAGLFYNQTELTDKLINKKSTTIRPKEVDLLALLETGNIDYTIIYKSVAIQHSLNYIQLPDEINLSNPEHEKYYNKVSTIINGSTPSEKIGINGSSIVYSFCFPKNSPNNSQARKFASFLKDKEKGGKILEANGMKVLK